MEITFVFKQIGFEQYSRGHVDLLTPTNMAVFEQKAPTKVTLDDTVPLSCKIEAAHTVKDHIVSIRESGKCRK